MEMSQCCLPEEFQLLSIEGKRKFKTPPLEHHSKNYHRQDPQVDTRISKG